MNRLLQALVRRAPSAGAQLTDAEIGALSDEDLERLATDGGRLDWSRVSDAEIACVASGQASPAELDAVMAKVRR